MPSAVLLSVISSISGCLWPIFSKATFGGSANLVFVNSAAIYASNVDDIKYLILLAKIGMDSFICCPFL